MSEVKTVWMPLGKNSVKAYSRARKLAKTVGLEFPRIVLPADQLAKDRDLIFTLVPAFEQADLPEDQRAFAIRTLKALDELFVIVQHNMAQGEQFDRKSMLSYLKANRIQ